MREYNWLLQLIREAGALLTGRYRETAVKIARKSAKDLVTAVDTELEQFIVSAIQREYPGDSIIAEENASISKGKRTWVIDPLDGTTNFIHRIPNFSISIALTDPAGTLLGAVHNPVSGELFHAVRGGGAFLNDTRLTVTATDTLVDALVITGFACLRADLPHNNLRNFGEIAAQVRGIRRFGSAALDLCYVACGRADAFWEMHLNLWDIAAGALIVEEAGGTVTDFTGKGSAGTGVRIVASNGRLHREICAILSRNEP